MTHVGVVVYGGCEGLRHVVSDQEATIVVAAL